MPRWTENRGLLLKDMREMHHGRIVAGRAGRPLNGFLTMTPLRSVPSESRRTLFHDQRSRLGQRLSRSPFELDFVGIFVREKKADDIHNAGEHCGALLWLPEEIDSETLLRCLSPEINARLDWNNGEAGIKARLDYLQKERYGQAEGYLKKHQRLRYPWEEPAPLRGARWSTTKGLDALIAADTEQREDGKFYQLSAIPVHIRRNTIAVAFQQLNQEVRAPKRERTYLFDDQGQGALFDKLEDMRTPERPSASARHRDKISPVPTLRLLTIVGNVNVIEAMRSLGPTHQAIAKRLGISRSHTTNILDRQFGPGRSIVRRVLELAKAA